MKIARGWITLPDGAQHAPAPADQTNIADPFDTGRRCCSAASDIARSKCSGSRSVRIRFVHAPASHAYTGRQRTAKRHTVLRRETKSGFVRCQGARIAEYRLPQAALYGPTAAKAVAGTAPARRGPLRGHNGCPETGARFRKSPGPRRGPLQQRRS
jgi:hypothetical protein